MRVRVFLVLIASALLFHSLSMAPHLQARMLGQSLPHAAHHFTKQMTYSSLKPRFQANVDLVVVRASVTDPFNRFVAGLQKEQFRIFEDKVEQTIVHFSEEAAPISAGIIFDISGSMKKHFDSAKTSLLQFLQRTTPGDEFFLATFNHKVLLETDFTNKLSDIQNTVALHSPGGRTALYDAVYFGLEKLMDGHNARKALIIITDGEDNSSRYSFSEVKELVKERDVQIYAIGVLSDLHYGKAILDGLAKLTGGRAFFPYGFNQLDYYIDVIHNELRNQYIIGYYPTNRTSDGKWRKIKVKLDGIDSPPKLVVRARAGYYSSRE